jgi:hypothetical protein
VSLRRWVYQDVWVVATGYRNFDRRRQQSKDHKELADLTSDYSASSSKWAFARPMLSHTKCRSLLEMITL